MTKSEVKLIVKLDAEEQMPIQCSGKKRAFPFGNFVFQNIVLAFDKLKAIYKKPIKSPSLFGRSDRTVGQSLNKLKYKTELEQKS